MIADFSGNYVNTENTKEGDVIEITGEGEYEDKELNGKVRRSLNLPVKVNGVAKIYSPSMSSGRAMVEAFGKDTKDWSGRKGTAKYASYKSFGAIKVAIEFVPLKI